jgi:hypothetical protein
MAGTNVRKKVLASFFLKAPLVLAKVEIQFTEMKQNRSLCRNQRKAIILRNFRQSKFLHLRQHFEKLNPGLLVDLEKVLDSSEYQNILGNYDEAGINRLIGRLTNDFDFGGYHHNIDAQQNIILEFVKHKINCFKDVSLRQVIDRRKNVINSFKDELDKIDSRIKDNTDKNGQPKDQKADKKLREERKRVNESLAKAEDTSDMGIGNIDSLEYVLTERGNIERAEGAKYENKINTLLRNFLIALDDDISAQFIEPTIDNIRKKVRNDQFWRRKTIDISTVQRTSILSSSRYPAKVSPVAKAYFQIPEPRMNIAEIVRMVKKFRPDALGTSVGNILISLQKNQWESTSTTTTITKKPLPAGLVKFSDDIGNQLCLNISDQKILFKKETSGDKYDPVTLDCKFMKGIVIEEKTPEVKNDKGKVTESAKTVNITAIFKKTKDGEDVNLYLGEKELSVKFNSDGTCDITNPEKEKNCYALKKGGETVKFEQAADLTEAIETKVEKKDPFNDKQYSIETGMGVDLIPVVFNDGESAILRLKDFGYKFSPESVDGSEKLSSIEKHEITTLVTARTFDLLQLSEFESQSTVTRRGQGIIPLFFVGEMVPFLRDIPLIGELFDRPSIQKSKLQRSVIFVNPMIFPVINDILDFSLKTI